MKTLNIDIETFSSVDIRKSGMYKYVHSPDFQVLLFAYSVDGDPTQVVDLMNGEQIPLEIMKALLDPYVIKYAFNAAFEWYCLSKFLGLDGIHHQHPFEWLEQWKCTMIQSMYCGCGGGLGATAVALGLPKDKRKMSVGNALIKLFCTPTKPTAKNGGRTRTLPHHEPEKWQTFIEYNRQDVEVEKEVARKLENFPLPESEWDLWRLDLRINATGVNLEKSLVDGAIEISDHKTNELMTIAQELTGLDNPNSTAQLTKWLATQGVETDNLRKDTVAEIISETDVKQVKQALELRQELSKTSVKKYQAMADAVCADGRVRGLLQFYGANRTGRWAGRLVQVQNLPRNYISTLDLARKLVIGKKISALEVIYGNVPDTLSQLIRTAFIPSEGNKLLISDFSAIEARVIAWLAGEQWRLDVFQTHGKIYEASASQMFGVPIELIKKGNPEYELRQKGKVAELALGYQGGSGALVAMGALDMGLTEEELPDIVSRWRASNKRIVDLWYKIDRAALTVLRTGKPVGLDKGIYIARETDIMQGLDFLTVKLPSGRKLYYAKPFLAENQFGREAIHYYGINQTTRRWEKQSTYGGKLTENIVQAIARDCLAVTLKRLDDKGYQTVMHIHDEVVLDVPKDKADLERVNAIMATPIEWAPGLPLNADGFVADYYQKD